MVLGGGAVSYERGTAIFRCRENVAHIRQSGPESGPGFQAEQLESFKLFSFRSAADRSVDHEGFGTLQIFGVTRSIVC